MFKGGAVVDELALQGRLEQPLADLDLAGVDGAEVCGEARGGGFAGDLGGEDLEVDQQAFFVLDDLRLGGFDAQVARGAGAGVLHHDGEDVGLGGFDLRGEGIVREHVALVEVVEREFGLRVDGDRRGFEVELHRVAFLGVGEDAAEEVLDGFAAGGFVGRDDHPLRRTGGVGSDQAEAVDGGDAVEAGCADAEQVADVLAGLVEHDRLDQDVSQRQGGAVVEFEGGAEGGAGEHGVLVEAQFHAGADAFGGRQAAFDVAASCMLRSEE